MKRDLIRINIIRLSALVAAGAALFVGTALILSALAQAAPMKADDALVFVVDCSGSMDQREVGLEKDAYETAIQADDVLQAIREGYYQRIEVAYVEFHADSGTIVVPWTLVTDKASAQAFAVQIADGAGCGYTDTNGTKITPNIGWGNTAIGAGLKSALDLLVAPRIPADRLVVDVSGDGAESENDGPRLTGDPNFCNRFIDQVPGSHDGWVSDCAVAALDVVRTAIVSIGATINAIPMITAPDPGDPEDLMQWYCGAPVTHAGAHVIGGPSSFCRPLDDIGEMTLTLRQKIVDELY